MTLINHFIKLTPVPKGRPKFGNGRAYTPKKTKDFERALATIVKGLKIAYGDNGYVSEKPIELELEVIFKKPQKPKSDYHITRPDLDNVTKGICDALNGVLWKDDSQICRLSVWKTYDYGTGEGIQIKAWELV